MSKEQEEIYTLQAKVESIKKKWILTNKSKEKRDNKKAKSNKSKKGAKKLLWENRILTSILYLDVFC